MSKDMSTNLMPLLGTLVKSICHTWLWASIHEGKRHGIFKQYIGGLNGICVLPFGGCHAHPRIRIMVTKTYIYSWKNNPRRQALYGKRCRTLAWGRMNSVLVEFEDGNKEVISRHALRITSTRDGQGPPAVSVADNGRWSLIPLEE
ncbi:hypothetical protein ES703_82274 [subsurface metagenome]